MAKVLTKVLILTALVYHTRAAGLNIRRYDATKSEFLQKIVIDPDSKDVYVGGQNSLFRFDSNLGTPTDFKKTGPHNDNINCNPAIWPCVDASPMNNDVKVLELYPGSNHLLYCGTVKQGNCMMFPKDDFGKGYFMDDSNKVNFVGSQSESFAFFGNGPEGSPNSVLYVGQSFDKRPLDFSPKSVSSRILKASEGRYNISYTYENPHNGFYSAMDIDKYYKESYMVDYIHGFEHEGFTYFVTVQRDQPHDFSDFETRLVRVCQNDFAFNSYTEVKLSCKKKNGITTFYNVAQAAYVAPIGRELSEKFDIDYDETMLYVVFGKSLSGNKAPDQTYGSGLCMYSMREIMSYFTKTQLDCYRGYGRILPWVDSTEPKCKQDETKALAIDDNWCGDHLNVGIGSRYPLQTETNVTSRDYLATTLAVLIYKDKTIAMMGTTEGKLLKVLIDGTNSPPYAEIDVAEDLPAPMPVARDIEFDAVKEHLYVLTGPRVSKVEVQSCRVYSECGMCVTTKDPLNCGWCENHCSTEEECTGSTWTQKSCPPLIKQFWPHSGPTKGGTKVTILGDQFGNATAATNIKATVALEDCAIDFSNSTHILCTTASTDGERERGIEVDVVDTSKTTVEFVIRGEARSGKNSFSYKAPRLTMFHPIMGPKAGGTRLTILGDYLDIGSTLDIQVVQQPCDPISIRSHEIVCNTSAWSEPTEFFPYHRRKRSGDLAGGTVNVTIDNARLSVPNVIFNYMDNPEINDVFPRTSILSGGLPITVEGSNLHVVDQPKIIAVVDGYPGTEFIGTCKPNEDGSEMVCQSPDIKSTAYPILPAEAIPVHIHFHMDGVANLTNFAIVNPDLSLFHYHVDPEFYGFDGKIRYFYQYETFLEIMGNYLDLAVTKKDVKVYLGTEECNITQLGSTVLICEPDRPLMLLPEEPNRRVEVHIGNMSSHIGELQFAERHIEVLVAIIALPIMTLFFIFIIIFIVCWMKRHQKGPFKKKLSPPVRYTAGDMGVDFGYAGQAEQVYRLNQNPYWSSSQFQRNIVNELRAPLLDDDSRKFIEESHLLIPREKLLLLDIIGQGHFGCVYKGLLKQDGTKEEKQVAVKTLKTLTEANSISSAEAQKFLEEALRMREFDHPHILRLIGIALDKEDMPLVVLPYMKHGDLLSYIRNEQNNPTVKDLMDFGIQISQGMAYLSKLKFVHRDLAARNCMLDDYCRVKVADFGLSRDIYERDYYSSDDRKAKLPVKWMALESLEKGIYNIKTDVWSYGVVLFELMTRGVQPYPEVDNWDIIKFLKSGRRMPQPSYCPDQLYQIMLDCWHHDANMRPCFIDLVASIQKIIQMMEDQAQQSVGLNITYVNVPTSQSYLYPESQHPYSPRSHSGSSQLPPIDSGQSLRPPVDSGASLRPPMDSGGSQLPPYERYEGAVGGGRLEGAVGGHYGSYSTSNGAAGANYNNNNNIYGPLLEEGVVVTAMGAMRPGIDRSMPCVHSAVSRPHMEQNTSIGRHHSNAGAYGSPYREDSDYGSSAESGYRSMPRRYNARLHPYYATPRNMGQTVTGSKSTLV